MPTDGWTIASAIATSASAAFAGTQIWLARRESNRRAALSHIQIITAHLRSIWTMDTEQVQEQVLECYGRKRDHDERSAAYMAFLTDVDVAARAVRDRMVDRRILREYLRTLLTPQTVTASFIDALQTCCTDPHIFEDLRAFLIDTNQQDRPTPQG